MVGLALLFGAVALVALVRHALVGGVEDAARLRAAEVARQFDAPGATVPSSPAEEDEELIQVVDGDGRVVASSPNINGRGPLARLGPGQSTEIELPGSDEGILIAVAAVTGTPDRSSTVIVARSVAGATEATQVVTKLLSVGLPVLLLVVAFTTWKVVGQALAPVEAIRREVDEISARQLHRRVPDPAGHDEISRLASTMNRMLARLQEAQVRQRRFVSDASHELRSPVASIRQHAEVAVSHPDRTTTGELAETVLAENLRVQRLVEDLLLLARADEHTLGADDVSVDVDDLVFDEARRLRDTTELGIDTTAVSAARVRGDRAQLGRLVRNLGDNAARHARSAITYSLGGDGGSLVLRVDDDGAGIPADEQERVFERFVRLDDARNRDHGGSGLGLAIVAEIAVAHGGGVCASTGPGGGARFEVRLPLGMT